jgi:hypothetical protein
MTRVGALVVVCSSLACAPRAGGDRAALAPSSGNRIAAPDAGVVDAGASERDHAASIIVDAPPASGVAVQPPIPISAADDRVLDDITRIATLLAQDGATEKLDRDLGRVIEVVDGRRIIRPSIDGFTTILVSGPPYREEVELQLTQPIVLGVLSRRFGAFDHALAEHDPPMVATPPVATAGEFVVRVLVITSGSVATAPANVLYLYRDSVHGRRGWVKRHDEPRPGPDGIIWDR